MCPKLKSSPHTSRACCLLVPTFEGHSWCIHCGPSVYYNLSLSHIYIYIACVEPSGDTWQLINLGILSYFLGVCHIEAFLYVGEVCFRPCNLFVLR